MRYFQVFLGPGCDELKHDKMQLMAWRFTTKAPSPLLVTVGGFYGNSSLWRRLYNSTLYIRQRTH